MTPKLGVVQKEGILAHFDHRRTELDTSTYLSSEFGEFAFGSYTPCGRERGAASQSYRAELI